MKNKKIKPTLPTVTIAICALNESANIGPLLESIKTQKQEGYKLEKILLISDGSTDATVEIAKSFKLKNFVIKAYKTRRGKSYRLNEIYSGVTSDIVVQPDADVVLMHEYVIRDVVEPFKRSTKIGMTGGNAQPLPAETFTESAVNVTLKAYAPFKMSWKGGNNVLSATGRLLALRKEVFSHISVPYSTIANDQFVYFCTISLGYKYRFAKKATVYFRSPQTLCDQIKQNTRFKATTPFMKRYFPATLVDKEYSVPAYSLHLSMLKQFVQHPILSTYIFAINFYCQVRAYMLENKINALWDMVYTTKVLQA